MSFKRVKTLTYCPVEADQRYVSFTFYSTDSEREIQDLGDPSLTKLENIVIESPDFTGGTSREIHAILQFGGTETVVTIKDENTGNTKNVSLHIPFKLVAKK